MTRLQIIGAALLTSAVVAAAMLAGLGLLEVETTRYFVNKGHTQIAKGPTHLNYLLGIPLAVAAMVGCICLLVPKPPEE